MRYRPSLRQSVVSLKQAAERYEKAIGDLRETVERASTHFGETVAERNHRLTLELEVCDSPLTSEDNPSICQ